ncbi:MAG: HlyD family secretion protein [Acidobacteriota bacterium]|nr:HlyD family secretion protein [Acidobacteriota bacterium]
MRGKWLLLPALGMMAALAVGIAVLARNSSHRPPAAPAKAVQQDAVPSEIILQGRIQAKTVVNLGAPMEGVLERVLVEVGDSVYEGQLLASIKNPKLASHEETAQADAASAVVRVTDAENASIAARLEAARARADATRARIEFTQAEKTFLRQQMLLREGATPRLVFEKAEKDYNSLKADSESLEQLARRAEDRLNDLGKELENAKKLADSKSEDAAEAKAELAGAEVHSTVDGLIVSRRGQAGEPVDRSMVDLFQIATNLAALQVSLTPDSKVLPRIKAGQPALLEIAEAPGGVLGSVREIRAGQVFVDFSSPGIAVKPGLTAQVRIKIT